MVQVFSMRSKLQHVLNNSLSNSWNLLRNLTEFGHNGYLVVALAAKLIVFHRRYSKRLSEKSNESPTLLQRENFAFISCFSELSCPVNVHSRFKPLTLNVTSVISSNPTRSSTRPRRSHSFRWI